MFPVLSNSFFLDFLAMSHSLLPFKFYPFVSDSDDIAVEREYFDISYSGTNFNRPGFEEMVQDMRKGIINHMAQSLMGILHFSSLFQMPSLPFLTNPLNTFHSPYFLMEPARLSEESEANRERATIETQMDLLRRFVSFNIITCFNIIPAEPGQILYNDTVNNAFPNILYHFFKSRTALK